MKKIKTNEVFDYIGETLAEDIYFKGFTLVQAGERIDNELAQRVISLYNEIPEISIESEGNHKLVRLSKFTANELYEKVKVVMRNYSFDNIEDSEMVAEIIESTISCLTLNTNLDIDIDDLLINEPDLYAHTLNTTILASLLAIKSSVFQRWMIQQIALGALLHDIGYTSLLRKYGVNKISELSIAQMMEHPTLGYELIENNDFIAVGVKKIVLMHHCWEQPELSYDKETGLNRSYPSSYKGKALPKESKTLPISIVQVASTFERLINKSHDNPIQKKQAISKILKDAEKIYGEGALLLANYISPYGVGDKVKLNNGKEATIIKVTSNPSRPIITFDGKEIDLRVKPFIRVID